MRSISCVLVIAIICSFSSFGQNDSSPQLTWGTIKKEKTDFHHIDNSRIIGQIDDKIYVERWKTNYVFFVGNYYQLFVEVYDKNLNLIKKERIKHSRKKFEPVGLVIDNYNRLTAIISDMAPHVRTSRKSKPAKRDIYYQFYDPNKITPKGKLKKIGTIRTGRDDSVFGLIRLKERKDKNEGKQFVVYSTNIIPFNFDKAGGLVENPKNFMAGKSNVAIEFRVGLDGEPKTGEISGTVKIKSKTDLFQKEPREIELDKELFSDGLKSAYKNLSSELSSRKREVKPDIRTNKEIVELSDRSYLVLVDVILYYTIKSSQQTGSTTSNSTMNIDEYHDLIVFHVTREGAMKKTYSIDRGRLSVLGFIYPVNSYVIDKGDQVNIIHHMVKDQNEMSNRAFQRIVTRENIKTGLTVLEDGNKITKVISSSNENGLEINSKIQSFSSINNSIIIYGNDKKKKKYALGRIKF